MKLLIVDDEELTRSGLISALDWKEMGITEIFQADDGVNGLNAALTHHPDIILCDVRMPRMGGIAMLERIMAHLPDAAAIFMSGYSDKEYLKAAIQLKAVNYIEKPIDPEEIKAAIRLAVCQCTQRIRQRDAETANADLAASQLAFELTVPYTACHETIVALCEKFEAHYGTDKFKSITTFIVKLEQLPENPEELTGIYHAFREFLAPMHLHVIYSEKRLYHIIYHVYGSTRPAKGTLALIAERLGELFSCSRGKYIAIGDSVTGISAAFHSYESAVILLQSSFFFEPGFVITTDIISNCSKADAGLLDEAGQSYIQALSEKNETAALESLNNLKSHCIHSCSFLPNQVKTVYYDLFSALYKSRSSLKLLPDFSIENHENIMDIMDSCFSYFTLHDLLSEKTAAFFTEIRQQKPENATVYLIKSYINSHYKDPGLSVKDISEYARLSASYVCTFFKNETGSTLNSYITEFRMEKARHLLADPRYRISDISAAVGYSDGNYFSKSFRKYTGFSPSEYREKVLR